MLGRAMMLRAVVVGHAEAGVQNTKGQL